MIELAAVGKSYGAGALTVEALRGVSFRVEPGEYAAIMGASGTGKSTLLHILGCLDRPTRGRYTLDGVEVASLDDGGLSRLRNRKIGFVFQQFHLLERTTALQNVLLPLIYADDYPADAEERARRTLAAVGLEDRTHHRPGELSGGEQQRVAVARALITDPAILLADEPTGNLDRRAGLQLLSIFRALNQEGRTLVVVTHDEEVAEHAHRLLVLRDGTISEDRPVAAPRDPAQELAGLAEEESVPNGAAPDAAANPAAGTPPGGEEER